MSGEMGGWEERGMGRRKKLLKLGERTSCSD